MTLPLSGRNVALPWGLVFSGSDHSLLVLILSSATCERGLAYTPTLESPRPPPTHTHTPPRVSRAGPRRRIPVPPQGVTV